MSLIQTGWFLALVWYALGVSLLWGGLNNINPVQAITGIVLIILELIVVSVLFFVYIFGR